MAHYQIKTGTQPIPSTAQEELTQAELDQVNGGGIRLPDKTPKGGVSGGMAQSLNFSKKGQDKSIIGVL